MSRFRLERPSPALVVSIISLVVATGGAGYAAVTLPKGSVGAKQLKNGVVTTTKIKNGAVTSAKIRSRGVTTTKINNGAVTDAKIANGAITGGKLNLNTIGTVPSANQANAAASASSAQPAAFAHVSSGTGSLDIGNSKNVGGVTVNTTANSLYCLSGIPFTPRGGQATVDGNAGGAQDGAQFSLGTTTGCPTGTQAMVYTYSASFGGTPDGFFVVLYA